MDDQTTAIVVLVMMVVSAFLTLYSCKIEDNIKRNIGFASSAIIAIAAIILISNIN